MPASTTCRRSTAAFDSSWARARGSTASLTPPPDSRCSAWSGGRPDPGCSLRFLHHLVLLRPVCAYARIVNEASRVPIMRALFVVVCACVLLLSAHHGISRAGIEAGARTTSMELLVFEHPDCTYCP